MITLAEAKKRVRVPDLWSEFRYEGEPRKTCFCPFHENTRTPAFSVFDDGEAWKCHAGCGEGSVVDFYAKAKGVSNEEACREILRRAGMSTTVYKRKEHSTRVDSTVVELPPVCEEKAWILTDASRRAEEIDRKLFPL